MKLHLTAGSVLVVAIAALVGTSITSPSTEAATLAVGMPFEEPTYCSNCPNCFLSSTKHKAPEGGGLYSGLHSDCIEIMPCGHPYCEQAAAFPSDDPYTEEQYEDLRGLVERVLQGEVSAIKTILARYPEKARLNRDRMALQVSACSDDAILSHVPLTPEVIAHALSATTSSEFAE